MSVTVAVTRDAFRLKQTFTISRGSRDVAEVLTVHLSDGTHTGRGECYPYARYGESLDSVTSQVESVQAQLAAGMDRAGLQQAMAPGAARNAVDCALWDLESKQTDTPVWQLAGLDAPTPITTAYTLSLESPEKMQAAARDGQPLTTMR